MEKLEGARKLNKEQREEFEELARPLIKWINENQDPHTEVRITCTGARTMSLEYYTGDILEYV